MSLQEGAVARGSGRGLTQDLGHHGSSAPPLSAKPMVVSGKKRKSEAMGTSSKSDKVLSGSAPKGGGRLADLWMPR